MGAYVYGRLLGAPSQQGRFSSCAKVRNSFECEVKATYFGTTSHFILIIKFYFTF